MGIYETDVDGMHTNYVMPQENGHRENVRWITLTDAKEGILITSKEGLGINVHNYTTEALRNAAHPCEIKKQDDIVLNLDWKHSGLGSNSCGQEQTEECKVRIEDFAMSFAISFTEREKSEEQAFTVFC